MIRLSPPLLHALPHMLRFHERSMRGCNGVCINSAKHLLYNICMYCQIGSRNTVWGSDKNNSETVLFHLAARFILMKLTRWNGSHLWSHWTCFAWLEDLEGPMQRQKPLRMRRETWSCLNLTPKTLKTCSLRFQDGCFTLRLYLAWCNWLQMLFFNIQCINPRQPNATLTVYTWHWFQPSLGSPAASFNTAVFFLKGNVTQG